MEEKIMTLQEIKNLYGNSIADACERMQEGKEEIYSIFSYEVITVKAFRSRGNKEMQYQVEESIAVDQPLELEPVEEDMDMDMDMF